MICASIKITKWPKIIAVSRQIKVNFSSISRVGFNDYESEKKKFVLKVPEFFNFAEDVIDKWAQIEITESQHNSNPAFWYVNVNGKEIKWSFKQLSSYSKKAANVLKKVCELGFKDRAIVILPKIPEWWLINIACIRNGTILSPGTIQLRAKDVQLRLDAFQPKVVITDPERALLVDQVVNKHTCVHFKLLVTSQGKSIDGWLSFDELFCEADDKHECVKTKSHDSMSVFFTSGTTGNPKMAEHSHCSYGFAHLTTGKYWLDLMPGDVMWNLSDTGWAKTAYSSLFAPWSQGACVFIDESPKFDVLHCLNILQKFPISVICFPPTVYRLAILENLKEIKFKALRHCVSAGEPLNSEVILKWIDEVGLQIYEGYGQTEMTLSIGNYQCITVKPGSMGKAMLGYDVRIVNENGTEVPPGVEGIVGIKVKPQRPLGLFIGYLNDPEKSSSCFKGDYYLTGDRAFQDHQGYFWFIGRDDDVILSSGYRIGPFEVESALLQHPAVIESAVVSSPDSVRGEVVKAFVVLAKEFISQDKDILTKELQEYVKTVTAPYKYPRKIEFVRELPKTISGKIRRVELRQKEWAK